MHAANKSNDKTFNLSIIDTFQLSAQHLTREVTEKFRLVVKLLHIDPSSLTQATVLVIIGNKVACFARTEVHT